MYPSPKNKSKSPKKHIFKTRISICRGYRWTFFPKWPVGRFHTEWLFSHGPSIVLWACLKIHFYFRPVLSMCSSWTAEAFSYQLLLVYRANCFQWCLWHIWLSRCVGIKISTKDAVIFSQKAHLLFYNRSLFNSWLIADSVLCWSEISSRKPEPYTE